MALSGTGGEITQSLSEADWSKRCLVSVEGGATLRGWFVQARQSDVGVVTVHGAGVNRSEFLTEAKILHDAGYPVLLFD